MFKRLFWIIGLLLCFGAGVLVTQYFYSFRIEEKVEQDADVLLERVKTVAKLVTVEGYFSEIYNYKDYWGYDWGIFRKKALMRVKAKVSVGYDLSTMEIKADEATRTIILSNLPEPELISIEHDIDYYDLQQGTFNSFKEEDYNKLNANAKRYIEERAKDGELFEEAKKQGNEMLDLIQFITESTGWSVKLNGKLLAPYTPRDTLLN